MLDRLQPLRERAFQLPRGDLRLVERLGVDEVADRFRLRQIDAAVEERSHGELARLGQACTSRNRHLNDMSQNNRRSMAGNFDHVVGRVRVRLREKRRDDFVDAFAGRGINQLAKVRMAGLKSAIMCQPQHGTRDVACLRPGEPHYADATPSRRRGNSDDSVVDVHSGIIHHRGTEGTEKKRSR